MKVDFIELTNFRGIQKQRIRFKNKNFVALIGDNGSGKTTILEGITKGFVPVLRTINAEAMKECDLANKDIRNGANGTTVTLGITLDGEKYVWTNRRRLSSQQPFENNGDDYLLTLLLHSMMPVVQISHHSCCHLDVFPADRLDSDRRLLHLLLPLLP